MVNHALKSLLRAFVAPWLVGRFHDAPPAGADPMNGKGIRLSKLDAARRQLRTAIELWFANGDPVSTHTLAVAAYEVVDVVGKKKDPNRRDLLFDTIMIKDEYRKEWIAHIKKEANFFKHADRDPEGIIDFDPEFSRYFIMFSILGLRLIGETETDIEAAFMLWLQIHHPNLLKEKVRNLIANSPHIKEIEQIRRLPKPEFFDAFMRHRHGSPRRRVKFAFPLEG